jgi:hypothetical protein
VSKETGGSDQKIPRLRSGDRIRSFLNMDVGELKFSIVRGESGKCIDVPGKLHGIRGPVIAVCCIQDRNDSVGLSDSARLNTRLPAPIAQGYIRNKLDATAAPIIADRSAGRKPASASRLRPAMTYRSSIEPNDHLRGETGPHDPAATDPALFAAAAARGGGRFYVPDDRPDGGVGPILIDGVFRGSVERSVLLRASSEPLPPEPPPPDEPGHHCSPPRAAGPEWPYRPDAGGLADIFLANRLVPAAPPGWRAARPASSRARLPVAPAYLLPAPTAGPPGDFPSLMASSIFSTSAAGAGGSRDPAPAGAVRDGDWKEAGGGQARRVLAMHRMIRGRAGRRLAPAAPGCVPAWPGAGAGLRYEVMALRAGGGLRWTAPAHPAASPAAAASPAERGSPAAANAGPSSPVRVVAPGAAAGWCDC